MNYQRVIRLKDGRGCELRNGTAADAAEVLQLMRITHEETDFLLTYPDEKTPSPEEEKEFLTFTEESGRAAYIVAILDGAIVGSAGIQPVGEREKLRHRASFGIGIVRSAWGLGIGRALTEACICLAREAGYRQLELDAVAENEAAIRLYESEGFICFGRNPRGFYARSGKWQELVLMRLEL